MQRGRASRHGERGTGGARGDRPVAVNLRATSRRDEQGIGRNQWINPMKREPAIDPSSRLTQSCSRTIEAQGATMRLLLAYIICLLVGQSLTIGFGLLVERYSTPYTGLANFIVSYFAMFWIGWRLAVRITERRSRVAVHTAKR
jgi:hypothetical protein